MTPALEASNDQEGCICPYEDKHTSDLYTKTSWVDAHLAYSLVEKGRAAGQKTALSMLKLLQHELNRLGRMVQRSAGLIITVYILLLLASCIGLKNFVTESRIDHLWFDDNDGLKSERSYTRKYAGEDASTQTHQMVLQTPVDPNISILHPDALLAHMEVLRKATQVTVDMYNTNWQLHDLCQSLSFPLVENGPIDNVLEKVMPCHVMTPLDCFWEGSKAVSRPPLLFPSNFFNETWESFYPAEVFAQAKEMLRRRDATGREYYAFPVQKFEDFMRRAGIRDAYQLKPCLNPFDPECPSTAPNKRDKWLPNVGAILKGGCYGFSTTFMQSPVEAIVGGTVEDPTNGDITDAKVLQSIISLMGPHNMYEFWKDKHGLKIIEWSPQKAEKVLSAWQEKFRQTVFRLSKRISYPIDDGYERDEVVKEIPNVEDYSFSAFTSQNLDDIVSRYTQFDYIQILIGHVLVLAYAVYAHARSKMFKSQCKIVFFGVMSIALDTAAGLGIYAMSGMPFNMTHTRIVPFLSLITGISDLFIFTKAFANSSPLHEKIEDQVGYILKKVGINILLSSLIKGGTFIGAYCITVPAMRSMVLQGCLIVLIHLASRALLIPCLISFDLKPREIKRRERLILPVTCDSEVVAPVFQREKRQAIAVAMPPDSNVVTTVLAPEDTADFPRFKIDEERDAQQLAILDDSPVRLCATKCSIFVETLETQYARLLTKHFVKVVLLVALIAWLVFCGYSAMNIKKGLQTQEIAPKNTPEHDFLHVQNSYLNFYDMQIVTKGGFDYAGKQKVLHDFHGQFIAVNKIIRADNGGMPPFWLSYFRDWLEEIQYKFDNDWRLKYITFDGWTPDASDEGIIGYRLLVQTGRSDTQVDKSQLTKARLVDNGIINVRAFYNYLSAWVTYDTLGYSASKANFKPEPRVVFQERSDHSLTIPKSKSILYAEMPFYLRDLNDTDAMLSLITGVRDICNRFAKEYNLPSYPSGIPFMFWEQYSNLWLYVLTGTAAALFVTFFSVCLMLAHFWLALIISGYMASCCVQIFGLFSLCGIPLSAITGSLAIFGLGLCAEPALNISLSFITAIGNKKRRVILALEYMMGPTINSSACILLCTVMLAFSDFDFIVNHFFKSLLLVEMVSFFNSLVCFPVILALIGPRGMIKPHDYDHRIATPSPSPPRRRRSVPRSSSHKHRPIVRTQKHTYQVREPSLSTITEESGGTPEIVVQPKVVLKTTTHHYHHNHPPPQAGTSGCPADCCAASGQQYSSDSDSSASTGVPPAASCPHTRAMATTKVTAKAHIEVEVHAPYMMSSGPFCPTASTTSSTSSSSSDQSSGSKGK